MRSFTLAAALAASAQEALAALRSTKKADPLSSFDMSCYVTSADDMGYSYRGLVTQTLSGRACQKWSATKPWEVPEYATGDNGNGLGNHNYCRNPDKNARGPWCYTMDTNEAFKIEACSVPECPEHERDFSDEAETLATAIGTSAVNCKCADQLFGSTKTTADTAVALAQKENSTSAAGAGAKKCNCAKKRSRR